MKSNEWAKRKICFLFASRSAGEKPSLRVDFDGVFDVAGHDDIAHAAVVIGAVASRERRHSSHSFLSLGNSSAPLAKNSSRFRGSVRGPMPGAIML